MSEAPVIACRGLQKVFVQGPYRVEVPARASISPSDAARVSRSSAHPARARARCCTCWAGWTSPPRGEVQILGRDIARLSESENGRIRNTLAGLRVPVPSPAAGVHRAGERGHAAAHPPPAAGRGRAARGGHARPRRACRTA